MVMFELVIALLSPSGCFRSHRRVAATSAPHRLLVILEGESLFNDASALLIYGIAVGAAMTGATFGWKIVPLLLLTCGGGVIAGIVLGRLYLWLTLRVEDIQASVILQFCGTFAVWIIADPLGLCAG